MVLLGVAVSFVGAVGAASKKRDKEPPSTPTDLRAASATASAVTFTWTASTDNVGVAGYDVSVASGRRDRVESTSYTVSGLSCGTTVSVSVAAFDRAQNRSAPATATGSTSGCGDTQAPSAPTGLTVSSPTQLGVTLSWNASSDNVGVVGYYVLLGSTRIGSTSATSYVVGGLSCGTGYTLSVVAYDAAENTSAPASTQATTATCSGGGGGEPGPIAGLGYHQVFRDDFSTLNRSVWDDHIWYDRAPSSSWTNFQYAANGILHLLSSRAWGYPNNTVTTQSAGLRYQLGYFETRMKWSAGRGSWPAFWLLSWRHATNPAYPSINPFCALNGLVPALCYAAELDVFEGQGAEPRSFYGTVHRNSCSCYGVGDQQNANNWRDSGIDLTADFHTYGMLWTATQITWYLDGRVMTSTPVYDSTNQPMFLILQMFVGGWTGGPDSTTPATIETQVDYVQVWQK
jgi:beta-glucanase (GH16 family)